MVVVAGTPKKRERKEESKIDSQRKQKWSSEDRKVFIELLREHGKNFHKIKEVMNKTLI